MRDHVKFNSLTTLAYFFLSYTDKHKQNTFNLLSSIAAQIFRRISQIPEEVISLYKDNMSRPPLSVLLEIISSLAQCFQQTYIVLDALDEIEADERNSLLGALRIIISNSRSSCINLLMTSRREPYLVDGFSRVSLREISLEASIVDEDIKLYVSKIVETEPKLSRWSEDLQAQIVQKLTSEAAGM